MKTPSFQTILKTLSQTPQYGLVVGHATQLPEVVGTPKHVAFLGGFSLLQKGLRLRGLGFRA